LDRPRRDDNIGIMLSSRKPRVYRVLVVDDEESVRRFLERVLTGVGYHVATASDGPSALKMVEEQDPFDLVVVDFQMPHMRGDEVARRLRLQDRDLKILYCTGLVDSLFDEVKTLWAQEAFVEKPISMQGLLEAVALMLFDHTVPPAAFLHTAKINPSPNARP
jgi:CheY-like chemotaxis protein